MKIKVFLLLFAIISLLSISNLIFSQNRPTEKWDDPNLDRIPLHLLKNSMLMSSPVPLAIVTTPDGYDNFYLGVDFAEPHMSVNPRNPLWFFNASNTNNPWSTYDGLNWFRTVPNFNSSVFGDPVTAYDSLGNLYYENMTGSSSITGTRIVKSTDNGLTWLPSVSGNTGNDKNWIAADQTGGPYANYVYGTMTNGTSGNFIRSTNQGASFSTTFSFYPQNLPGMMVCVGPRISTGVDVPGGCVYVVTNSGNSFNAAYTFYVSTDGGLTFTTKSIQYFANYVGTNVGGRNSVENMRTRPYPFITADNSYGPYRGRLYLIYASNDPPGDGNKPDIFCRYSNDQGATWSAAVKVNDDPNTALNHQWHPATWCDKQTGRLFVKWLDTRRCPTSDSCDVYASYSDNGGQTFVQNQRITNKTFKINCTACGGGGTPAYQGDYDAITSTGKTSMMVWADYRQNTFGTYTAYFPDYAMTINPLKNTLGTNDSLYVRIIVPSVKLYDQSVKFSAAVDTLPLAGTLQFSFLNNKDSLTSYPDSITLRIKSIGTVTPKKYGIIITGRGPNGTPVHQRNFDIYVGVAPVSIGTNREGICEYKVNGQTYNTRQTFVLNIGSTATVQAVSPRVVGGTRYVYTNWSNSGDTTQNVNITGPLTLTAFYKTQYRLTLNSQVGNSFGGGLFYDSAVAFNFGVNSKFYTTGGRLYQFRGWTGAGTGSYTSPDSLGNDTIVNIAINNAIVETARWQDITGIINISSELPSEYRLYQNYPNPFNPITNIKFDIIKTGNVKIVVYDALGREISILADQIVSPGSYSVTFEGNRLSSGMYYYRIITLDFTDIKRMVIIK